MKLSEAISKHGDIDGYDVVWDTPKSAWTDPSKITEIIPKDIPKWMRTDMAEGQLFNRMLERYNNDKSEIEELKKELDIATGLVESYSGMGYEEASQYFRGFLDEY